MVRMSNPHPEAPRVSRNGSRAKTFAPLAEEGPNSTHDPGLLGDDHRLRALESLGFQGLSMPKASSRPDLEAASSADALSYEAALAELEQLVAAMEAGQMPLDRLLEGYRRGADLLALCRGRLKAVEDQVQALEEGRLKPLESGRP